MERKLRIANHQVTGSRLGFIRPGLTVRPFTGPLAGQTITAELYYKPEYWRTNRYFEWQDKMWHAPDRTRSEEHTSETPVTNAHLVCRLLLEKKKHIKTQ